ncbi:MAG TPA: chemotaxis protein CheW [Isosphaeraceae bacterium]|nr:chemotaxis protein CheW [Isosphaeraceae bacterium]
MLLLTFTAGAKDYAVDVARVVELVPRVELRAVPHAPAYLAGLLGYRGQVVPVIDLGVLVGAAPCQDRLSTRIILVNDAPGDPHRRALDRNNPVGQPGQPRPGPDRHGSLLGLIAEQVIDLTPARPEQVVPAPVHLPQAPYLDAIAQLDHRFLPLIAVEKIRESVPLRVAWPAPGAPGGPGHSHSDETEHGTRKTLVTEPGCRAG